jgi:transcriptional regulator with XRE-family HTH domain
MTPARYGVHVTEMPARVPQTAGRTRLGAARAASGLTQEELAEAIGIPIASYRRIERGEQLNPPIRCLVNAAIALGCDLEDLIDDWMRRWYHFNGRREPPPEWRQRPEVRARAERWERLHGAGE